jgi:predicted transcriptional regulator
MSDFRSFLAEQMQSRQMNKREFARFLGISESSLYSYIKQDDPQIPGDDTLLKIHIKTSVPLTTLIELRDPGISRRAHLSAHAQLLAEQYEQMSVDQRRIIDMLFENLVRGNSQD